jgi:hypothetical protein
MLAVAKISWTVNGGYVLPSYLRCGIQACFTATAKRFSIWASVHDFRHMCQKLKRVRGDMAGAVSISRNAGNDLKTCRLPHGAIEVWVSFDHIYAFEKCRRDAEQVYKRLPEHWLT